MSNTAVEAPIVGSVVGVFCGSDVALQALSVVRRAGYGRQSVSVIGSGVTDTRSTQGWVSSAGGGSAVGVWGGFWGWLSEWLGGGFFWLPRLGWTSVAGWLATALADGKGDADLGVLATLSIPIDEIDAYLQELKAERYLVVVSGEGEQLARAHIILESAAPLHVTVWNSSVLH